MRAPQVGGRTRREVWSYLRGLSVSQWLLLLYPVVIRLVSRSRAPEQAFEVDTSAMVQVAFTAACGLYVLRLLQRRKAPVKVILFRKPMVWLLVYGLVAMTSAVWSERPDFTLYRAAELTIFLVLSVDAMVRAREPVAMVKLQMVFAAIVIVLGMLLPSGFSILEMHSSEVPGTIVGVAFLGFLVRGLLWRSLYLAIVLAIILGTSAGTFVSVLVGLGVMLLCLRGRWAPVGALLLTGILGLGVVSNFDFDRYIFWGKTEAQIRTGSGRLLVWEWVLRERVSERPVLGYGFGMGETLARTSDPSESTLQMMHMHSAGMSAVANLGAVGLFLLLMLLFNVGRDVWGLSRARAGPLLVAATAAVAVNSQMVASVTSSMSVAAIGHDLVLATVAVASYLAMQRARRVSAGTSGVSTAGNTGQVRRSFIGRPSVAGSKK